MTLKRLTKDTCARLIAPVLKRLAPDPKYFELWQEHGFHVSQVHHYQPLPDTRLLVPSLWKRLTSMVGLDLKEAKQLELLELFTSSFKREYEVFPRGGQTSKMQYYLGNLAFESVDAEILYCMIRSFKP